jgi:hypothetical protein
MFLEAALVDGPEFGWNSRVNWDRTRQEITQLDLAPYRTGFFYIREGEELGTFYGTRWASTCSDLPEGTDCADFDVNDDGYLVYVGAGNSYTDGIAKDLWGTRGESGGNSYDWGIPNKSTDAEGSQFLFMGNTTPDFNLSWSNNFRYKNFSIYALLDGEFGADVYNQTRAYAYRDNRSGDQDQAGKADGLKKNLNYGQVLYNVNANSSHFVEDGTFVKLREASVRYTLDQNTVQDLFGGLGIDGMSLNLIGRNLLTFTDYTGYDPESGTGASGSGGGSEAIGRVDNFGYPNFRTFTAALEIIF